MIECNLVLWFQQKKCTEMTLFAKVKLIHIFYWHQSCSRSSF